MKRMMIMGLCFVAALAMAAVTSAAASAELPEYMVCGKATKMGKESQGHYTSKECTEESEVASGGRYELEKGFGRRAAFTARSANSTLASSEMPGVMECKSTASTGELTGTREAKDVLITSAGCEAAGLTCTSAGAKAGEIVTNPLKGELGYLAGKGTSTPTVGLLLLQESTTYTAEFDCEGVLVRIQGPVIAEVTGDVNRISTESTYAFRQSDGVQQFTGFEGGAFLDDVWRWEFNDGKGYEPEGGDPSGLELTASARSDALEIKA
jgi:hypothetical protein